MEFWDVLWAAIRGTSFLSLISRCGPVLDCHESARKKFPLNLLIRIHQILERFGIKLAFIAAVEAVDTILEDLEVDQKMWQGTSMTI